MQGTQRSDDYRRLGAQLRDLGARQGAAASYHDLMMACGRAEAEGGPLATASDGTLLRLGQHMAGGLRVLYAERYGTPAPDASGTISYVLESLLRLVHDLETGSEDTGPATPT